MSLSVKDQLTIDATSFTSKLIQLIVESTIQGDMRLPEMLGLDKSLIKSLEKLSVSQLQTVASKYVQSSKFADIKISNDVLESAIHVTTANAETDLVDKFILRGACNNSLKALFGWQSMNISNRRAILGVKTKKGRATYLSEQQQQVVFDVWMELKFSSMSYADKVYAASVESGFEILHVFKVVERIERLSRLNNRKENSKISFSPLNSTAY